MEKIIEHFHPNIDYSWGDALNFVQQNPEIEFINQEVFTKSVEMIDERNSGKIGKPI